MKHSETRQDPSTREWVVIAPERPMGDMLKVETARAHEVLCPFCPGNENMTPAELLRVPRGSSNTDWQLRVVPDKFAALTPDIPPIKGDGFFRRMAGFGHHEIVIEHPHHNIDLTDMPVEHVLKILQVYRTRQHELRKVKNVRSVSIFRNHGSLAGAACNHPHAQIIASAVIPELTHRKQEIAKSYASHTQRNLYSEIWEAETSSERLIETDETMAVFVPFAAAVPYEMWIMPRASHPSFSMASDRDLEGLAGMLHRSLLRLRGCWGDVAYGLVIYSCAVGEEAPYYRWHVQITPRVARAAGAELGPHICINPMLPEDSARNLRQASLNSHESQLLAATYLIE
ncbi:MAG: DUF4931 domain-containing protein [Acidobacteriia bacterium]|nr:DUF4931 domain-containing protein [Terriglobia bacterium]